MKKEEIKETPLKEEGINNPEDFRIAVANAQMEGQTYLEVTEKLFNYLVRNQKTDFFTYGEPGIKVYKIGTKEQAEKKANMHHEAYHEHVVRGQLR